MFKEGERDYQNSIGPVSAQIKKEGRLAGSGEIPKPGRGRREGVFFSKYDKTFGSPQKDRP